MFSLVSIVYRKKQNQKNKKKKNKKDKEQKKRGLWIGVRWACMWIDSKVYIVLMIDSIASY